MGSITVRSRRIIRASPERVWRALTVAEEIAVWMPPGFTEFDQRPGGTFRAGIPGEATASHGTIVTFEPPRRLAYRCVAEAVSLEMRIAYTLEPHRRGTRVTVEEGGFEGARLPSRAEYRKELETADALGRDLLRARIRSEGRGWAASLRKLLKHSRRHGRKTLADLKTFCEGRA